MNPTCDPGPGRIERFRHRAYETVTSADVRDQQAAHEALLAWHNRALHGSYGVANGLEVTLPEPVDPGRLSLRVGPGLAYDASGRPLILSREAVLAVPYEAEGMTLAIRADGSGAAFAWVPTEGFGITDGVGVARTRALDAIEA